MKKYTLFFTLIFFTSVAIFAEGIADLKSALNSKDTSKIQLLLESADKDEVKNFEAAILDKAKKAVSEDDLDYASKLSEMVLLFDFDNSEARKKAEEKKKQEEEQRRKEQIEEMNNYIKYKYNLSDIPTDVSYYYE